MPGKAKTAVRCCYWGYKIFQAARLCVGDYTALVELLSEGFAELTAEEALTLAVEAYDLAKTSSDVGKFTGNLSSELARHGSSATEAAAAMEEAHTTYEMFVACDTDGDGQISKAEFIHFASKMGETRDFALQMFAFLDKNGDGHLSFEEWILQGQGEDDPGASSLNCPGLHGLAPFTTPISGYWCDKCGGRVRRGTKMLSCRRCEHDVCLDCAASALENQASRVDCPGHHGLAAFRTRHGRYSCNVCRRRVAVGAEMRGCRLCDYHVCTSCRCAATEYHLYRLSCPSRSRHELIVYKTPHGDFSCDACRTRVSKGKITFACRKCNHDVCMECVVDSTRL